jgi:hypothetical protein
MKRRPLLPVEIEPFAEPRWARIEREMFAKLDTLAPAPHRHALRLHGFAWWGGAAGAALAGVALWFALHAGARTRGSDEPVRLATEASASRFTLGESALTVAPDSLVLVRGDDERGIDVALDHGRIDCEVAPRRGRPPFVVDAGEVRVRVVGTAFTVAHDAVSTSVEVVHGVVEVTARGAVTTLRDGDRWRDPVALFDSLAEGGAPVEPSASPSPTPWPAAAPRAPAAPQAQAGPVRAAPSPMQEWPEDSAVAAPGRALDRAAETPAAGSPSAHDQFEAAARLERSQPDRATAVYRQLASGDTEWAPNALFALARLESDRGRRADAVRLLRSYLARYPRGINADDARSLLAREQ